MPIKMNKTAEKIIINIQYVVSMNSYCQKAEPPINKFDASRQRRKYTIIMYCIQYNTINTYISRTRIIHNKYMLYSSVQIRKWNKFNIYAYR